jgi:hypothetical protein
MNGVDSRALTITEDVLGLDDTQTENLRDRQATRRFHHERQRSLPDRVCVVGGFELEYVFHHGWMGRTFAERILTARITGTVKRYARGRSLTETKEAEALAASSRQLPDAPTCSPRLRVCDRLL